MRAKILILAGGGALVAVAFAMAGCSSSGNGKTTPSSAATASTLPTTADSARLPGPRLFEAVVQSGASTILVQADLNGLIHVEYQDAQAATHSKNCHAEGATAFQDVLTIDKTASSSSMKLTPDGAASLLGMYQLPDTGGLQRLILSGGGDGPLSESDRATIGHLLAAIATGCRP